MKKKKVENRSNNYKRSKQKRRTRVKPVKNTIYFSLQIRELSLYEIRRYIFYNIFKTKICAY